LQLAFANLDRIDKRAAFFVLVAELSDDAALAFCTTDDRREMCLVLEHDERQGELLGGCRLVGDGGPTAEFSVWLRSELKGRGLGRRLMEILIEAAEARGVRTVLGHILVDNVAMIRLARAVGFQITRDPDDFEVVSARWEAAAEPRRSD
jgi:acetyltransferase